MPLKDRLAALLVITIWGSNFIVMKLGLRDVPPLLMGASRFFLVCFPAILFIPRPAIPLKLLVGYGLTICFGQFAFLFSSIAVGMPAGLASLVLQSQVFFTLVMSVKLFGTKLQNHNWAGMIIAFLGLAVLIYGSWLDAPLPVLGFIFTLLAGFCWAMGNVFTIKIGKTDVPGLMVWGGLVPIAPYLIASLLIEGPNKIVFALENLTINAIVSVAYLAFAATYIGYGLWGRLLARHPVWKIAPLTLLVPVVGLSSSWFVLGEALVPLQIVGAGIILLGLLTNVFGNKLKFIQ